MRRDSHGHEIKRPPYGGLECRGRDLNSRPRAYESPALPLSYLGVAAQERRKYYYGILRLST